MNLRHVASCGLVLLVLALTGCDEGRQRPAQTAARVLNVAPGFVELQFRREHRDARFLEFTAVEDFTWDLDSYDFYVLERDPVTLGSGRQWTFSRELKADVGSYTFVLAETGDEISPLIIENPPGSSTQAQVIAVHAAAELGAVDLYIVEPGVGIAGATPRGTFAPFGQLPTLNLPPGDYEFWLTTAGNPADVLFASTAATLFAGPVNVVVTPEGGATTADFSVVVLQAFPVQLYDRNVTAELRVINGTNDTAPRDFVINRQFSAPLFSAVPFAAPTAYTTVPAAADQPINVTPVGNPGVLELDQLFSAIAGQRWTLLFTGDAGTLFHATSIDDNRSIHSEAKLRFFDAATQFILLDFVIASRGGDPNLLVAPTTLVAPGIGSYVPLPPGDYDLYLRTGLSYVAGPVEITLAAGGVYSAMAVNGPDSSSASLLLMDGFN
jgi:hypothetical protein